MPNNTDPIGGNINILPNNTDPISGSITFYTPISGSITFYTESREVLRFDANGDIFVQGRLTTNDLEIVESLKEFLTVDVDLARENKRLRKLLLATAIDD